MSKYPPLFKRVEFNSPTAGQDIAQVQAAFEDFWKSISPKCDRNSEKTQAMRKLQEACMWFTRAIALNAFKPESDSETVVERRLPPETLVCRDFYEAASTRPIITIKKSKEYVK